MSTLANNIAVAASVAPARAQLTTNVQRAKLRRSTGLIVRQHHDCKSTSGPRLIVKRWLYSWSKTPPRRTYRASRKLPERRTPPIRYLINKKINHVGAKLETPPVRYIINKKIDCADAKQGNSAASSSHPRSMTTDNALPPNQDLLAFRKVCVSTSTHPTKAKSAEDPVPEERRYVELRIQRLLQRSRPSYEKIFQIYQEHSRPHIKLLSGSTMSKMLYKFSLTEPKDWTAMSRYLALAQDMKTKYRPLELHEWNSAIAFAGQCLKIVDEGRVEAALEIWREMEHEAQFKADIVTFNILLDVAIKAHKFRLVDMILREIRRRRLTYTRHTYMAIMYLNGLQKHPKGVRKTYNNFIDEGGIVDAAVLNCLILSLMKSGANTLVTQIYAFFRTKAIEASSKLIRYPRYSIRYHPDIFFRKSRQRWITRTLYRLTHSNNDQKELRKDLQRWQERTIIQPDDRTFKVMIYHFALQKGDFFYTWKLLRDMQDFLHPLSGKIFVSLFKAFKAHGGVPDTEWTCERLELVWKAFLMAVDGVHPSKVLTRINDCDPRGLQTLKNGVLNTKKWAQDQTEPLYFSPATAELGIRAFVQCAGPERAAQVWIYEIEPRWREVMTAEDVLQFDYVLASIGYHAEMKAAVRKTSTAPITFYGGTLKKPSKQPTKQTTEDDVVDFDNFWSFSYWA